MPTIIIGILNVTPDSFSDGGLYLDPEVAMSAASRMRDEGADIIDIGAVSTRPSAASVSAQEELRRLAPVLERVCVQIDPKRLSVDAASSEALRFALSYGVGCLNLCGGLPDDEMLGLCIADSGTRVIVYPSQTSCAMSDAEHVVEDRVHFFRQQESLAARYGLERSRLIFDPGIGFGVGFEGCVQLVRSFGVLVQRFPGTTFAIGVSRKRHLARLIGSTHEMNPPQRRVEAGLAAAALAVLRGATYVRTHDVQATKHFFLAWNTLVANNNTK